MSAKTLDGWTGGTGSRTGTGAATVESEREREIGTRIRAGSLDGLVFGNFYLYSGYCLESRFSCLGYLETTDKLSPGSLSLSPSRMPFCELNQSFTDVSSV